jgi:hypothetical protein
MTTPLHYLWHAQQCGQEDGDHLPDVGGDHVADELLGVGVDGATLSDCTHREGRGCTAQQTVDSMYLARY